MAKTPNQNTKPSGAETVTSTTVSALPSIPLEKQYSYDVGPQSKLHGSWFPETLDIKTTSAHRAVSLFPYKFLMVKFQPNGSAPQTVESFTLPISPQQIDITTPFAITVTPTLNGVIEEHNSTRFRDITIAGTTGVMPARGVAKQLDLDSGGLDTAIRMSGALDTATAFAANVPYIQLKELRKNNLESLDGYAGGDGQPPYARTNMGYFNLHRLRNFLETYAEMKKDSANTQLRLVFANYKDNQFYLVTPTSFIVRRTAESPLEYRYQIGMKAWGRYDPNVTFSLGNGKVKGDRFTGLQAVLSGMEALKSGVQLLGSALPWASSVLNTTINSVISGIGVGEIGTALRSNSATALKNQFTGYVSGLGAVITNPFNSYETIRQPQTSNEQAARVPEQVSPLPERMGQSSQTLTSDTLIKASDSMKRASVDIADTLGLSSETYDALTGRRRIPPILRNPSAEQLGVIFALNHTSMGLNTMSSASLGEATEAASPLDYVAGLASKSGIAFQKPVSKFPVPFPYGATLEDLSQQYLNDPNRWLEIATLNGLNEPYIDHTGFDAPLIVNGHENKIVLRAVRLEIGQAVTLFSQTGIRSTYGVLAVIEISPGIFEATLDNDPIKDDLVRYKVSDKAYVHYYTPNTVHVGQSIYIPSNEAIDINEFNSSQIPQLEQFRDIIRVSGVDLLVSQSSTNSAVRQVGGTTVSTNPNNLNRVVKAGTMDLVVDPNTGDVPLSIGLTNIQQSLFMILFTPKGTLLQHPDFGVSLPVGESVADIDLDSVGDSIKKSILQDRSFSDVEYVTVSQNKSVLSIQLAVRVAQSNKLLPVSFDVNLR